MQRKLNKTALFLALSIYTVSAFKPLSKEEQIDKFNKMNEEVEPFRRNLTECARQVKATMVDVENFLKRIPQATMQAPQFLPKTTRNLTECARQVRATMVDVENFLKRIPQATMPGKCFVACILRRNNIIKNNKISEETLLEVNRAVYGEDGEVMSRLKSAIHECYLVVEMIFEICEYASVFNDCMHMKMEHILDKVTMERRMEALGQMTSDPDAWSEDEDELLKLVKDEL